MDGFPILSALTYVPLVGAAIIFFWPKASPQAARWVALGASLVSLALSLVMLAGFDTNASGMQFVERFEWLPALGVSYHFGVDGISVLLIVLSTLLTTIGIVASWSSIQHRVR